RPPPLATRFPYTTLFRSADITVEWKSGAGTPVMDDLFNGGNAALAMLPWENPEQAVAETEYVHHSQVNRMAVCNLANELSMQFQDRKSTRLNSSHVKISY